MKNIFIIFLFLRSNEIFYKFNGKVQSSVFHDDVFQES